MLYLGRNVSSIFSGKCVKYACVSSEYLVELLEAEAMQCFMTPWLYGEAAKAGLHARTMQSS